MKTLGVQLYTIRDALKADYYGSLKKLVEFGYQAVEPAGFFGPSIEQAKLWFTELGLSVPSIHTAFPVGENRDAVLKQAQTLGCRDIISGFGSEAFATGDKAKKTCETINKASIEAAKRGCRVGYHNHYWEMYEIDKTGKSGYDFLIEECGQEVFFEADTYWVQVGLKDTAQLIERLGKRCAYLHVKDGPGGREKPNVAVGNGIMPWPPIFKAAKNAPVVFVELDSSAGNMMADVGESARYLKEAGLLNVN